MAKELKMRLQCAGVNRQRGGTEQVTLTGVQDAEENRIFFRNFPNVSLSAQVDNVDGMGAFDPEMDYILTFTPVKPNR